MSTVRKIRFKTWYWGQWVYEGQLGLFIGQDGVEIYDEAAHGWHNSEEAREETAP